jgi:hypothetical protein
MAAYPVTFNLERPEKFDRAQVVIRILVLILLSFISGILGLIYLAVPVFAAILISQKGAETYLREKGGTMMTLLRWYFAIYSYLLLLTDRFPTEKPEELVTFDVSPEGSPSVGSALLRIIFSIPSAIVVGLLGIVGFVIAIIAVIMILIQENYSEGLYDFQAGIMRWQARLMGYHASFVDQYPPFAVDGGPTEAAGPAAADSAPPPPPIDSAPPPPEAPSQP